MTCCQNWLACTSSRSLCVLVLIGIDDWRSSSSLISGPSASFMTSNVSSRTGRRIVGVTLFFGRVHVLKSLLLVFRCNVFYNWDRGGCARGGEMRYISPCVESCSVGVQWRWMMSWAMRMPLVMVKVSLPLLRSRAEIGPV
eukprot:390709-Ditylum_brightwellii.AAC.1